MRITFISADATLPLRSSRLREGWELERCRFDSDLVAETFHLAQIEEDDAVLCVLSCHPNNKVSISGKGYQLRGMATHADFEGRGLGKELVKYCISYLKEKHVDYLWCNARRTAYSFYANLGFEFMSPEFTIGGAGPHREMVFMFEHNNAANDACVY